MANCLTCVHQEVCKERMAIFNLPEIACQYEAHELQGEWIKGDPWTTGRGMGEEYGYYYNCSKCGYKVKGGYKSCDIKFCQECGSDNRERR